MLTSFMAAQLYNSRWYSAAWELHSYLKHAEMEW